MRKLFPLLVLLWALPASAQIIQISPQTINVQDSGTQCSVAGTCAEWAVTNQPTYTVQVVGTFSGTLTFRTTSDGRTWVTTSMTPLSSGGSPVTTTTTTGQFSISNTGILRIRVVGTTVSSGAATLTLTSGTASAMIRSSLPTPGTSGNVLTSDGTNWASSPVSGAGLGDFSSNTSSSTTGVLISFADTSGKIGKSAVLALTAGAGSAMTVAAAKSLTFSNTLTFTGTDLSSVAFGAGGTVAYAGVDVNTAGQVIATHLSSALGVTQGGTGAATLSGVLVGNGTSAVSAVPLAGSTTKFLNEAGAFTTPSGGGTGDALVANPLSQFAATTCAQLRSVLSDESGSGTCYFQGGNIGTPSAGVGTNLTGVPISTAISGMGTGVAALLGTFSSANLLSTLTTKTGTGLAVFGTTPTLGAPVIADFTSSAHNHSNAAGGANLTGAAFAAQVGNVGLYSPADGSSGTTTFRAMVSADLPPVTDETTLTTGVTLTTCTGSYILNFGSPDTIFLPATSGHVGCGVAFSAITGSSTVTLDGNGSETICNADGCATTKPVVANQAVNMIARVGYWQILSGEKVSSGGSSTVYPKAPGLRLTTESGVCASTSDRTAQGTIYLTPCQSSYLSLYSGSVWVDFSQAELSLALTATTNTNYYVFACYNSGTPALSLGTAWSSNTPEALALQDGMKVRSSDHTCLEVGTMRASGTNATSDVGGGATSQVGCKRFLWNEFNRVLRPCKVIDTTANWPYTTQTWRQANGAGGNRIEYVSGDAAYNIDVMVVGSALVINATSHGGNVGIGIDSTSTPSGFRSAIYVAAGSIQSGVTASYQGSPGIGYHAVNWLEYGSDGTTGLFLGANDADQSGMRATLVQ